MTFTVSTADNDMAHKQGDLVAVSMGVTKIWKGDIVLAKVGDGYAYSLYATGAQYDTFLGIAAETIDNSAGSAGDLSIRVYRKGVFPFIVASGVQTMVGDLMYGDASTNGTPRTVAATAGHSPLIGPVVEYESTTKVWVDIQPGTPAAN